MSKKQSTKTIPSIVMLSLWRDDMHRRIQERTAHLLAKSYPNLRFIWVVGDSSDDTENYLRGIAEKDKRVKVIRHDTHILGEQPDIRLERLSLTVNAGLMAVRKSDTYILHHESDLVTPVDVVEQLLATGKQVVGGWVTLGEIFYDTYLYRKDGVHFTNHAPHHACYKPDELFELDSIGSVVLYPSKAGVYCQKGGLVEICQQLKAQGYSIWCDPRIKIIQPHDLFTSRSHASA